MRRQIGSDKAANPAARILVAGAISILALLSFPGGGVDAHALSRHPFRIVIDPGHGGSDHGTVYDDGKRVVMEKNATLLLAQQVARQLRERGMTVILTRTRDIDVPLGLRTTMANRLGADVFLSIHMNSTQEPSLSEAEGVESYILNNTTDASSRRLARLENTVLGPGAGGSGSPEKLDVALILRDLRLDANLSESKRLACAIQSHLRRASVVASRAMRRRIRQRNRGVKQALFHVLLGAEMPSVLVEAGFLNNPMDRAMILSPRGRRVMAASIAEAVEDFHEARGTGNSIAMLNSCRVH